MQPSHVAIAAEYLISDLRPFCQRIELAGAVRRWGDTGKIDLLAVPRLQTATVGLFREEIVVNSLWLHLDDVASHGDGPIARHPGSRDGDRIKPAPWGEKYRRFLYTSPDGSRIPVDLWTAPIENFGAIWLIRTGPDRFSRRYVSALRRVGLEMAGGQVRQIGTHEPIATPCEAGALSLVGWPWVRPAARGRGRLTMPAIR